MTGDIKARRAAVFGATAAAYDDHRPDYPTDAVRWALEPVQRPGVRVLDLAAGTGKLAATLAAMGAAVTAVEPDPGMLAELRRRLPAIPALQGSAEAIPLPNGSVDAVLVAQAFHWFDPARAFPEIARVLAPGGVLAGLWNRNDTRTPWVAGLEKTGRSRVSFARDQYGNTLPAHPAFEAAAVAEFDHAQPRTADTLTETFATYSHALVLEDAERAELLARIRTYLQNQPETANGTFDLPIITTVSRTIRT